MAEHRHAEVLRAIADGKAVQFQYLDSFHWFDYGDKQHINPIEYDHLEWRVKPEPKPDYYFYAGYDTKDGGTLFNREATIADGWTYKMKITIDGETNEPKSVELIK